MNTVGPELSEELYELSGWKATYMDWHYNKYMVPIAPKYDLGYLLIQIENSSPYSYATILDVISGYMDKGLSYEDAAATFAISVLGEKK